MRNLLKPFFYATVVTLLFLVPSLAAAAEQGSLHAVKHPSAIFCLIIFIISYIFVLFEEKIHLSKSKPVLLGAGLIWVIIAMIAPSYGVDHHELRYAVFHGLEEYGSLMLFLLSAMTYIATLQNRNVFAVMRAKLVNAGLNLKQLFWATGILAFFLSPIADNLTTALVLGAVVMAVGRGNAKFISISCVNIVSAANAGGAFSPFGDITTLMVWQAGKADFFEFFDLFLPSLVCFLIPAIVMTFFIDNDKPEPVKEDIHILRGGKLIIGLGILTIAMAVSFEQVLGLPPFLGMMTGLSFLMFAAYWIGHFGPRPEKDFDIFNKIAEAEWDTLLFFFGVIFSVGGLGYIGYLEMVSNYMYDGWGHSATNIFLGFASAIIDNIPVMFAVLSMNPEMDHFQWLLITLTAGVGGTMLSIGSAAGVALMGTAKGHYTFMSHLKWTPILFLGYAAAVAVHFLVNWHHMHG
ncbi:MAG: sodium:proton antiporter NhaD [Alphaproteobacteria bacterium]|jgi:Na+/H+ antiporter NhaD/arsenite permease-like protein|nr:sodium:proton antiporter NhaD [Alphaproteobacteria bacterium]MDP7222109.1 sodium:proton antiporter NhaD [Alphaproteobacteria bacterium]